MRLFTKREWTSLFGNSALQFEMSWFVRAGFGTCPLGLISVWLPVRVLSAPPRTPMLTEISRGLTNTPRFCGAAGPACSLCREEGPLQRQFGAFCLWRPKTVSPERGKERPETRFACDRDRPRVSRGIGI